jgi:iron-sulfur cluster repair protein YtfE (RIC family)
MSMTTTTPPATLRLMNLPGQAHVAEGPLDLNGMYLAHHAFRRDLGRFAVAARETPLDATGVWRALAVRWEQFSGILHHHHTTEDDVLWPQLLEIVDAAGDASGRATLEAMEAEHALIDPLLQACAAGFASMAQEPDAATRDRLARATAAARDTLSDHMGHEETEALPLVQQLLSSEGWERVEKAAGSGKSAKDLLFLVPWVADGLTPAQLETAYRSVGQAFRVMVALTRGRHARREAVAWRFAM